MLGPGHLSFPIIHPPFHLLSILIYDSIISSVLRAHATPSSAASWRGHPAGGRPPAVPQNQPTARQGIQAGQAAWARQKGPGDPRYLHDGVRVLGEPGRRAAQDLPWGQRLALGDTHLVLGAQLLCRCLREIWGQRGQSVAESVAEAGGPRHCWQPLGTPRPWQSQLHGAPAAMAVLSCPSIAAVEGSWSARGGTVTEGSSPARARCSARLSQRIN